MLQKEDRKFLDGDIKLCRFCKKNINANTNICPFCEKDLFVSTAIVDDLEATINQQEAPEIFSESNFISAGFWRRGAACLIDGIIFFFSSGVLFSLFEINNYFEFATKNFLFIVFSIQIFNFLYFTVLTFKIGSTPGKLLMSIKVVDFSGGKISYSQSVGRYFSQILSAFFFFIGYLIQPFNKNKQTLHDLIAGTRVICKSEPVFWHPLLVWILSILLVISPALEQYKLFIYNGKFPAREEALQAEVNEQEKKDIPDDKAEQIYSNPIVVKLLKVDTIGTQRDYFEKIAGPAKRVQDKWRQYDFDGCLVSITEDDKKSILSIGIDNLSKNCTFDSSEFYLEGPAHDLTFAKLMDVNIGGKVKESCLEMCGNMILPSYGIEIETPHSMNFIQIEAYVFNSDESDTASTRLTSSIKKRFPTIELGSNFVGDSISQKLWDELWIREFKNIKVSSIRFGFNVLNSD